MNRSDLINQFVISVNQALTNLNRYSGFMPSNMVHSEAVKVRYLPLSSPESRWHSIAAQAIALDVFRCHTRAFCLTDECFKDFLLSRMLQVRGSQESKVSAMDDCDWHSEVTLEVAPHPELSETQAKIIALDYGMRGGKTKIKVRRSLLYYALRRLGLDTDPAARKPQDQQIVLLNREQLATASPMASKL